MRGPLKKVDIPAAQLPVAWRPILLAACGSELPLRPASEVMAETGGPHRGDTVEEGVGVDVAEQQGERRAERAALEEAGEHLEGVGFLAGCGEGRLTGAPAGEVAGDGV